MDIHDELKAAIARAEAAEAEVKRLKDENESFFEQLIAMRHTTDWHKSQEAMKLQNELVRQRDEAFHAGAEAMREAAAWKVLTLLYEGWDDPLLLYCDVCVIIVDAIRAHPIPAQAWFAKC